MIPVIGNFEGLLINIALVIIAVYIVYRKLGVPVYAYVLGVIIMMYSIGLSLLEVGVTLPFRQVLYYCILSIGIPAAILYYINVISNKLGNKTAKFLCILVGLVGGIVLGAGIINSINYLPQITNGIITSQMVETLSNVTSVLQLGLALLGGYIGYLYYRMSVEGYVPSVGVEQFSI